MNDPEKIFVPYHNVKAEAFPPLRELLSKRQHFNLTLDICE